MISGSRNFAPRGSRARVRLGLVATVVVASTTLSSACSIAPDSAPRDIASEDRDLLISGTATADEASGEALVYLVAPNEPGQQRQLRSVQRDVAATPEAVLDALFTGPSQGELDSRFVSAVPAETRLLSARRAGNILFVDISGEINDLTGEALSLAVAQIVFTASELPGVQVVRLRVNGDDQAWPRGEGQSRQGDLRVFDFPGLVETRQPPYPAIASA